MNRITFLFCAISFMTALSRSSNWPRYLVPAMTAAMSSESTRWSVSDVGAVAARDELGEALDDGRLAHARLADQDRVVLLAPARISMTRSISFARPMVGSSWPSARELGEVAAEVVERRRLGLLLAPSGDAGRGLPPPACWARGHVASEEPQRLGARLLEGDPGVVEDLRGDALLLAQQPEQQVLGAHVGVVELAGFGHRELEHLLGARRIGKVGPGPMRGLALLDRLLDLLLDLFEVDVQVGEHGRRDALALADEAEQDVLGAHVVVVQADRLLPGHLQDLPNPIGEVVPFIWFLPGV